MRLQWHFGTMIGGKKIIITVGEKLTKLEPPTALLCEMGTVTTLLLGCFWRTSLKYKSCENDCVCERGKEKKLAAIENDFMYVAIGFTALYDGSVCDDEDGL